ncbi:MAG: hypothetical protein DRJ03_17015 [Chloroflexi bacterium]|nr:MAG: hypothetical protein DRJ03_17015 [Chloroflexota bacterium]
MYELGYFIAPEEPCPPGYVKVKTLHPFWRAGEFYQCVTPEAVEHLRAEGLLLEVLSGLGYYEDLGAYDPYWYCY